MAVKKDKIVIGMTVVAKESPTGRIDVEWEVVAPSQEVADSYVLERMVAGKKITRLGNWRNISIPEDRQTPFEPEEDDNDQAE